MDDLNLSLRADTTQRLIDHLGYGHLPPELQEVSRGFHDLGHNLLELLHDNPELTRALEGLVAAKDWAVRSRLGSQRAYDRVSGIPPLPARFPGAAIAEAHAIPEWPPSQGDPAED